MVRRSGSLAVAAILTLAASPLPAAPFDKPLAEETGSSAILPSVYPHN